MKFYAYHPTGQWAIHELFRWPYKSGTSGHFSTQVLEKGSLNVWLVDKQSVTQDEVFISAYWPYRQGFRHKCKVFYLK